VVMKPLYVILLALFNDISMLPIADDNACPSSRPEIPSLPQILTASVVYGGFLTLQTLGMFEFAQKSSWLSPADKMCAWGSDCDYILSLTYIQISIAIELVIFSCRTPSFILSPKSLLGDGRASWKLIAGVMFANVIVTLLGGFGALVTKVQWGHLLYIWLYNFAGLIVVDLLKVVLTATGLPLMSAGASFDVLGYPELPTEGGQGTITASLKGSIRSVRDSLTRSQRQTSFLDQAVSPDSMCSRKSSSILPFPHNARAILAEASRQASS